MLNVNQSIIDSIKKNIRKSKGKKYKNYAGEFNHIRIIVLAHFILLYICIIYLIL